MEMVMVILMLSLLAAVAIPNFLDLRADAKNATTKAAVGALRTAIAIAATAIQLREQPNTTPKYPTISEMRNPASTTYVRAQFDGSHPVLNGVPITDLSGVSENPWSISTWTLFEKRNIGNPGAVAKGTVDGVARGWLYTQTDGKIWPNTANNGGVNAASSTKSTENHY